MNHRRIIINTGLAVLCFLWCGAGTGFAQQVRVLATTGMIADVASNVGQDLVEVTALMGPGVDPHLYQATARDVQRMRKADIIFYNGLHLEAGLQKILEKMPQKAVAVTKDIPEDIIQTRDHKHDPHVWMDVSLWIRAVETVRNGLIQKDPANRQRYEQQAKDYLQKLQALHGSIMKKVALIPENGRVLITAHDAFAYFGKAYGMEVKALMGISTQTEAGTKDVQDLTAFIVSGKIKAIFVESSVPEKYVEAVQEAVKQKGFDVQIGGELFSDAMGAEGTFEGTYIGMLTHNTDTIVNALK